MHKLSPLQSKAQAILYLAMFSVVFTPVYGMAPKAVAFLAEITHWPVLRADFANLMCCGLLTVSVPVLLAELLYFKGGINLKNLVPVRTSMTSSREVPPIVVCGMKFSYSDLFVNFLITGRIGTGKTSVAIWSLLDQMFTVFSKETAEWVGDPFLKLGGLALDVKGDFAEAILYFAHMAKRNVVDDIRIIRPKVRIPVAKFKDERGYFFFVSALQTTAGTEFDRLIKRFRDKDGNPYPASIADLRIEERKDIERQLQAQTLDVRGVPINFVGWRKDGDILVRVTHTPKYGELSYMKDAKDKMIKVFPPKDLTFVEFIGVHNGLTFNLINPRLSSAEAAKRLVNIGKLASGDTGGGGDNQYWSDAASRQIAMCIEAWKLVKPTEITGPDVLRISSQREALKEMVEGLRDKSQKLEEEAASQTNPDRVREIKDLKQKCDDIRKYLSESWDKLEPKTKGITESVIQNMFGPFLTDGFLKESFCSPATIRMLDACEKGTFFCLVTGREYEALQKTMSTAIKSEFQAAMLERPASPYLNKTRTTALVIDECQSVAVAGGKSGGGDEHFMATARQAKCVNINATQSDSSITSVIGRDNADVYLQAYSGRIWLANSDPKTNERASTLCGKIHREEIDLKNPDYEIDAMFKKDADKVKRHKDIKLSDRYRADEFANLDNLESITLNMGQKGKKAKVHRQKNSLHSYASMEGRKRLEAVLEWYSYASIEQDAWRASRSDMFNHDQGLSTTEPGKLPINGQMQDAGKPKSDDVVLSLTPGAAKEGPGAGGSIAELDKILGVESTPEATRGFLATSAKSQPTLSRGTRQQLYVHPSPLATVKPVADEAPRALSVPAEEFRDDGPDINMAQIRQAQRTFKDKATTTARAMQQLECIGSARLINPQVAANERSLIEGAPSDVPDKDALGPRGKLFGRQGLALRAKPIIPIGRRTAAQNEKLDLASEINLTRRSEHEIAVAALPAVEIKEAQNTLQHADAIRDAQAKGISRRGASSRMLDENY